MTMFSTYSGPTCKIATASRTSSFAVISDNRLCDHEARQREHSQSRLSRKHLYKNIREERLRSKGAVRIKN